MSANVKGSEVLKCWQIPGLVQSKNEESEVNNIKGQGKRSIQEQDGTKAG